MEVLVLDEDTASAARWAQPLRVQLRRWLWGGRLHRQSIVVALRIGIILWGRSCGVAGWWGGCIDGCEWRSAAVRRVTGGLRGHALQALAGEGDVGRERINLAPGPVIFENRVTTGSASASVR